MFKETLLLPGLNSSTHGTCCPARLVIPFKLSACNSFIHNVGNGVREDVTLLAAPGVAGANTTVGGAGLTVVLIPELDNRSVSGPPLVLCRYQKLSVYVAPMFSPGDIVSQMELL